MYKNLLNLVALMLTVPKNKCGNESKSKHFTMQDPQKNLEQQNCSNKIVKTLFELFKMHTHLVAYSNKLQGLLVLKFHTLTEVLHKTESLNSQKFY